MLCCFCSQFCGRRCWWCDATAICYGECLCTNYYKLSRKIIPSVYFLYICMLHCSVAINNEIFTRKREIERAEKNKWDGELSERDPHSKLTNEVYLNGVWWYLKVERKLVHLQVLKIQRKLKLIHFTLLSFHIIFLNIFVIVLHSVCVAKNLYKLKTIIGYTEFHSLFS